MGREILRAPAVLLAAMAGLGLGACSNTATIHYKQPASCYIFDSDPTGSPHTTTSAGNGMFEFFDITSIENKASGAKDFNFMPNKLFANSTVGGNTVNNAPGASFSFLIQTAQPKLIPKGTTVNGLGRIVINVAADDPQTEKTAKTNLLYKSAQGESVLLVRDPPDNPPQFLDPCTPTNVNALN